MTSKTTNKFHPRSGLEWFGWFNGLYKAEVIHRRGPWRSFAAVEFATLPTTGSSEDFQPPDRLRRSTMYCVHSKP